MWYVTIVENGFITTRQYVDERYHEALAVFFDAGRRPEVRHVEIKRRAQTTRSLP